MGRVFASVFVSSRWLAPTQVSEANVDSRSPTIAVVGPGEIEVSFHTPQGVVTTYTVASLGNCATIDVDNNGRVLIAGTSASGQDHLLLRYVVGEPEHRRQLDR